MNSRERTLKTFKRLSGIHDRVPVQFELCHQLADHFGIEMDIPVAYAENSFDLTKN